MARPPSSENPLMDERGGKPGSETCGQHQRQGQTLAEAEEGNQKEQAGGEQAPQSPSGELLHDARIAAGIERHPDQYQRSGQRHDTDQPAQRWPFAADGGGGQDDGEAEGDLEEIQKLDLRPTMRLWVAYSVSRL